jgi:hypothetical protein
MAQTSPSALMAPKPNLTRSRAALYSAPFSLKRHAEISANINKVKPHIVRGECVVNELGRVNRPVPASAASSTFVVWKSYERHWSSTNFSDGGGAHVELRSIDP